MTRARNMPPPIEDVWPAVCLVRPQMGENIGAVARVLLNFGLVSLRLVAPRDRWPNPKAEVVAVGADHVLTAAKVEWKLEDALADATLVVAATARPRGLEKPVWGPRETATKLRAAPLHHYSARSKRKNIGLNRQFICGQRAVSKSPASVS